MAHKRPTFAAVLFDIYKRERRLLDSEWRTLKRPRYDARPRFFVPRLSVRLGCMGHGCTLALSAAEVERDSKFKFKLRKQQK